MKQQISIEQLNELSEKGKERLINWWEKSDHYPEYDNIVVHVYIPEENDSYHDRWNHEYEFTYPQEYVGKLRNHRGTVLPILNIGQMIEFLEKHYDWKISLQNMYDEPIFCDALWEAVKDLLEHDKIAVKEQE